MFYIIQIYTDGPVIGTPVVGPQRNTICLVSQNFLVKLKLNHIKFNIIANLRKSYTDEENLDKILSISGFYFETLLFDGGFGDDIKDLNLEDGKYYILKENRNKYSIWRYLKNDKVLSEMGVLCNYDMPSTYFLTHRQFANVIENILDVDGEYFPPNKDIPEDRG